MNFIYKTLDYGVANSLLHWCDTMGVEYDIWNANDLCAFTEDGKIEIGLYEEDWKRWNLYFIA